jgi:hypothetical protein
VPKIQLKGKRSNANLRTEIAAMFETRKMGKKDGAMLGQSPSSEDGKPEQHSVCTLP